ncbi:type II secretion system secretin GspD [uncultured Desulfobacter sp.]|uniref:type II secretion system secretin GspD n=1 Tax=uncultured Desulfobacter sp. TaxID=240139 RepID=UPI002AAA89A8|nr:type II secretion system secretin GspD [uncultured Desulfobacter sp.]
MLQDRSTAFTMKHIFLIFMVLALVGLYPVQAAQNQDSSRYVSMDFNDVDIGVFIKFISKLTQKNFVVDTRVKGKVTIISPEKISVDEAYKVFESVLDIYGFATVEVGSVTKIIPTADARGDNVDTRVARPVEQTSDKLVTRLIPLTYASSEELKSLLTPMLAKGSILLSHADSNMLIVTATLASIERLLKLIKTIDVEGVGRKITILPIKYADAEKMVTNLTKIYSAKTKNTPRKKKSSTDLSVEMVADERTNSVILLATEQESAQITALVEALDKEVPKGEEKIRVYYLEHATAEDLATVLQEIPEKGSSDSKKEGQKKAPLLSDDIKITADKATNSLIIIADKDDYPVLEEVIKKLDVPRSMVYIECLIMEMNADRSLNLGMEWQAAGAIHNDSNVTFGGFGTTSSDKGGLASVASGVLPSGFSMGIIGETLKIGGVTLPSYQAILEAYKKDSDVKILSTPQLLTTENEEATITIGKNVPYQTRGGTDDSSTTTYNAYEYKDVGITLKITPSISQDRLVRLAFYQEVTKLDTANTTTSTDRPTTLKRELETTIIVEDRNTVVIGGLIDESLSKEVGKVPCLGDIPLLGNLFKSQSSGSEKTNLFIFLTPRVVKNTLEAKEIYKEKKDTMDKLHKQEIKLYDEDAPVKSMLLN